MSRETLHTLNTQTLIGFTEKRGEAWHYRFDEQGEEGNHYPGAIPAADVHRRLFDWEPLEADVSATALSEDGVLTVVSPNHKALIHPETHEFLGIHTKRYQVHSYGQWLVTNPGVILDVHSGDLGIGSAGVLGGGRRAWVQIEMEETIATPEGVDFRPFLTAMTSLDGSLATTYQKGVVLVRCDNTLAAAAREDTEERVRIRHTRNSLARLGDVREALSVVVGIADDFTAEVASLAADKVSDAEWARFVEAFSAPTVKEPSKNAKTIAAKKADELQMLWTSDDRVAPWKGTALGVLQAANTWEHHFRTVRNVGRFERNMERVVKGQMASADDEAMRVLESVR